MTLCCNDLTGVVDGPKDHGGCLATTAGGVIMTLKGSLLLFGVTVNWKQKGF